MLTRFNQKATVLEAVGADGGTDATAGESCQSTFRRSWQTERRQERRSNGKCQLSSGAKPDVLAGRLFDFDCECKIVERELAAQF